MGASAACRCSHKVFCDGFLPLQLKATASEKKLPVVFHGARDHLDPSIHGYRVFVNPSTSDVVATTTAEALAMGMWAVVADLPCNKFFKQFSNCLTYRCALGPLLPTGAPDCLAGR